jgi:hypothetical protein
VTFMDEDIIARAAHGPPSVRSGGLQECEDATSRAVVAARLVGY